MARIAVFASGNGSNFESLANSFIGDKENKIVILICNKKDAFVLKRADKLNIPYKIVEYQKNQRRSAEIKITQILKEYDIDLVLLAGFMKILSEEFLQENKIPIINIHPSLLPKHKGENAIQKAYDASDSEIGISIHYVTKEVDSGEIIIQKSIPLEREKGIDYVEEQVHKLEHQWYPYVAKMICEEINKKKY
jgi:phosphoribosylglycinamide formyltransferase-1